MDFNYSADEQQAIRLARYGALTPGEKRELLYFLDVATLPSGSLARMQAVMEKVLETRLRAFGDLAKSLREPYDVYLFTGGDYQNGLDSGREGAADQIEALLPTVGA